MSKQNLRFLPFVRNADLVSLLDLKRPAFSRGDPFTQVQYLQRYLCDLGCQAILIEDHYVDRDYIEDHSLFYSRTFSGYAHAGYVNHCRRVHFFSVPPAEVEVRLTEAEDLCRTCSPTELTLRWRELSERCYLGFTVVKPLRGSPVGRTVLRCVAGSPEDGSRQTRVFPGTRRYSVHLGAVKLEVIGLPFQQQDVGVSACATTALWSALHRLREFEEIGSPTPAQITTLATQYSLPFGRPMPSDEGLSIDQMCQSLQSLRVSPCLLSGTTFDVARAYIHDALRSGFAPVLILEDEADSNTWHAVTAVGYRQEVSPDLQKGVAYDLCNDMIALYVHDDRIGPYQRVDLIEMKGYLRLDPHYRPQDVRWIVRYVLVPLHSKIRISVSGLREIAFDAIDKLMGVLVARGQSPSDLAIAFELWITRPSTHLQDLLATSDAGARLARMLVKQVSMPRYVGVVRITGPTLGTIDFLIDTTSTMKNLHFIAVTSYGGDDATDPALFTDLASAYQCEALVPSV